MADSHSGGGGNWFRRATAVPDEGDNNGEDGNHRRFKNPFGKIGRKRSVPKLTLTTPESSSQQPLGGGASMPSDPTTTGGSVPPINSEADRQRREQQWKQLEDDEQAAAGKPGKSSHQRAGMSFPQRVSSLLNLTALGGGGGGGSGGSSSSKNDSTSGGSHQKDEPTKIASSFRTFTPARVDPLTPAVNDWRIPAAAAAAAGGNIGPSTFPSETRIGRGKQPASSFQLNEEKDSSDDNEDDSDLFAYERFPKVAEQNRGTAAAWHNPNLMQMVETLQSAMMGKRNPMEHIPVVYNSTVLALIEGFGKLTAEQRKTQKKLEDLNNTREKELEGFRGMCEEWIQRENGYKAEIKRLELLLAKESKDGLASVTMARQNSLIDRSGAKKFQARLKRMSGSQDQEAMRNEVLMEEPEDAKIAGTSTHYNTIGDLPRNMDSNKDQEMSRLVEKREREDRHRFHGEPHTGPGEARQRHKFSREIKEPHQHMSRQSEGQRRQVTPKRTQPGAQSELVGSAVDLEPKMGHDKPHGAHTLSQFPEFRGPKLDDTPLNYIDDDLTVERGASRSAATAQDTFSPISTGSNQYSPHKPTVAANNQRKQVETEMQRGGPSQSIYTGSRRYSFSHGDDEVLPVSPLVASFKEPESNPRIPVGSPMGPRQGLYSSRNDTRRGDEGYLSLDMEAESRRTIGVPTRTSSRMVHGGTARGTGSPLSTSTSSSSSTSSVVWLGSRGNPTDGTLDTGEQLSGSGYIDSPSRDVGHGRRTGIVSGPIYSPETLNYSIPGSVIHSSMEATNTASVQRPDDRTGSPAATHPSVSATPTSDPNTCQQGESSLGGMELGPVPPPATPAEPTLPSGVQSGRSSPKKTANTSGTENEAVPAAAAPRAVVRED